MKRLFGLWCLFLLLFSCKNQGIENDSQQGIVTKSDKANILSYMIKDGSGGSRFFSIDNVKNTITLSLPVDHGINLTEVAPIIMISKNATISPSIGEKCDFSSNKTITYELTSESGKTKKTYTASVEVLDSRKNLSVESITIHGMPVVSNNVTISENYSIVEKSNIEIKFTAQNAPSSFSMNPEVLRLNAKGDNGTITLSTNQTDIWNAWSETITITRGGGYPVSDKCLILSFVANGVEGFINENNKTIRCVLPANVENNSIVPIIKCSKGATVSPASKEERDFSNGPISYTVTAEDGHTKRVYSVSVEKGKSNIAKIVSFKIGSVSAVINHDTGKITAEVEKTVALESIAPEIELSKGAKVSPRSGDTRDFRTPVTYTVTAEDGYTKKKYTATITHKKSNEAKIKTFEIGSVSANIDDNAGKIITEVAKTVHLNAITPTITVSDGATVSPASGVVQDFTNSVVKPIRYIVVAEDGKTTKVYEVSITHIKSNEAKIVSFNVGSSVGVINGDKTINVVTPYDTDLKVVSPTIVISEYATVIPNSGVVQDFSGAKVVEYVVTAEDGITKETYSAKVVRMPKNIRITVCDEVVQPSGGKLTVAIAKTINKIEKSNVKVEYTDDDSSYTTVDSDYITLTPDDQSTLNGETGTLKLTIHIATFGDYASMDKDIEVSKKA